jgi:hypothetical protein
MKIKMIAFLCFLFPISAICQTSEFKVFKLDFSDDHTSKPYLTKTNFSLEKKGTSVEIIREIFKNDFLLSSKDSASGEIDFKKCRFLNTRMISPEVNLTFEACHFKNIQITPPQDSRDEYKGFIYIDTMENEGDILISDVNLSKAVRLSGKIGGSVTISNVMSKSNDAFIDLTGLRPFINGEKIKLNLIEAPFSNIKLNYENFRLDTAVTNHPLIACGTYINLLDNFKKRGQTTNYEVLDIEYQHYKYITKGTSWDKFWGRISDFIDHYWWNYGYSRGYVLLWTLVFLSLFSLINWPFYQRLNDKIYPVKGVDCSKSSSYYNSLIYTCAIFFTLSLDLEKLKYERRAFLAWFIFIYLIGVVCLAYSVNFVLKAGQPIY